MTSDFVDRKHLFWSADVHSLDVQQHKKYIIHQVLQYGDVADFKWLSTVYPFDEIQEVFVLQPRKSYSAQGFNFVKNYLLHISEPLKNEGYVSTFF